MTMRGRRVDLLLLAIAASMTLLGATPALQPLVTRVPQPHGPVPPECIQSLATPAAPRVLVAEIPAEPQGVRVADLQAPPSDTLRRELRGAQTALENNDRPAFDEHLGSANAIAGSYPPGAERRAAEELVRIYDDAARVWDAQFESPFFDDASPVYTRLRAYPGWAEAVRRGVLTDDAERRFYPASESRRFLTGVAADRLGRIGIHTPAPRMTTRSTPTPSRSPSQSASGSATKPSTKSTRGSTEPRSVASSKPRASSSSASSSSASSASSQPSSSRTTTSRRRTSPAPVRHSTSSSTPATRQQPAAPRRASAPSSPDPSARRTPPPVAATPAPVTPPPAAPAAASPAAGADVDPATTTPDTTETTPTEAPETTPSLDTVFPPVTDTVGTGATTPDPAVPATPGRTRSVIIPTILILIGLGVLIVLFRASK